MRTYITPLNTTIILSFLIGFVALIINSGDQELFLFREFISVDLFFFATILFWGLLYLKFVLNRMKKTGAIATLLIWTLPPAFAIISIFIIIEMDSLLLAVTPTTLILLLVLFSIKAKIFHILYAIITYLGLSIALVGPVLMSLFFLPCLNTSYEIYERDGITYVESHETFLAQEWETTYRMTSPITMVEVE